VEESLALALKWGRVGGRDREHGRDLAEEELGGLNVPSGQGRGDRGKREGRGGNLLAVSSIATHSFALPPFLPEEKKANPHLAPRLEQEGRRSPPTFRE